MCSSDLLPRSARSGLMDAVHRLRGQEGIAVQEFSAADVVRHPLVARIVRAYLQPAPQGGKDEAAHGDRDHVDR